jgi:hypothetical protein
MCDEKANIYNHKFKLCYKILEIGHTILKLNTFIFLIFAYNIICLNITLNKIDFFFQFP